MILFEKKYQTFDTVFHHQMKHLEVRQKYSAARRIFNSLLGVSSGDETLHLMFDILLHTQLRGVLCRFAFWDKWNTHNPRVILVTVVEHLVDNFVNSVNVNCQ